MKGMIATIIATLVMGTGIANAISLSVEIKILPSSKFQLETLTMTKQEPVKISIDGNPQLIGANINWFSIKGVNLITTHGMFFISEMRQDDDDVYCFAYEIGGGKTVEEYFWGKVKPMALHQIGITKEIEIPFWVYKWTVGINYNNLTVKDQIEQMKIVTQEKKTIESTSTTKESKRKLGAIGLNAIIPIDEKISLTTGITAVKDWRMFSIGVQRKF